MKRFIDVHAGEVMAGRGDVILRSDTNNACLVIAAHDSTRKIGGLAHAIFLSGGMDIMKKLSISDDTSSIIDKMIEDMTILGSKRDDIEICLVTGENVPHTDDDPVYCKKIASAIELLKKKHIKVKKETAPDAGDTHVSLDVESGNVFYSES